MLKFDSLKKVTAVDSLENLHGTAKLFKDTAEVGTGTFRTSNIGGNVMVDASVVTKEEIVSPAALLDKLKLKLVNSKPMKFTVDITSADSPAVTLPCKALSSGKCLVVKEESDPSLADVVVAVVEDEKVQVQRADHTGKFTFTCTDVILAESVATDPDMTGDVQVTAKANAISKSAHISVYTCLEEMSEYHRPESATTITDADVTRSIA